MTPMHWHEVVNLAANPIRRLRARRRRISNQCAQLSSWTAEDEDRLRFYSQFVARDDLVFDVGANLGNRTKVFARLGAHVIAIEPQPECCMILRRAFAKTPRVTVCQFALASDDGQCEMYIGSEHTLTSLSQEWIAAVRESGRFSDYQWSRAVTVRTRSLDSIMRTFGRPSFIKIDVEGYELEVLSGLSSPVPYISFEFTPERMTSAFACIEHLAGIAPIEVRISLGESMKFNTPHWVSAESMHSMLRMVDKTAFGDIYVRSKQAAAPMNL